MKKISLQLRLTLLMALIILICSLGLLFSMMYLAMTHLDTAEDAMIYVETITEEEIDDDVDMDSASITPNVSYVISETKMGLQKEYFLVTIACIVLGSQLTYYLSKFALKPLHTLSQEIDETTENNLYEPLPEPESKDEIARLSKAFNDMRQRLNTAFTIQKQFSANAAHELRTPLAVMQTSLEVFQKKEDKTQEDYEQAMETTLKQAERLNHLINALLEFQTLHTAPMTDQVYIPELVEEIVCDLDSLAEEKNVDLSISSEDQFSEDQDPEDTASQSGSFKSQTSKDDFLKKQSAEKQTSEKQFSEAAVEKISGNEVLLYRAIYNLTENAIKYNKEGGKVRIQTSTANGHTYVRVTDTGAGIPQDQWQMIFDAFYRVDKSRSRQLGGAGLGLAMVKEIANLHRGDVFVERSSAEGTTICFVL